MSDFDAGLHPGEEGAESVPAELIISLLDSLAQCIYVLDRTGRFIYVNSAFVRYTATPRHILLRKNIHEIKHTFKIVRSRPAEFSEAFRSDTVSR